MIDLQLSVLSSWGATHKADSTRRSEVADVTVGGSAGAER